MGRSALLVRGADAVRFVDNFTTAAVARLEPGRGTEGFFTDARGHVLALVNILRTADGLWLDAAPGVAARLREHLDHYLIREQVEFVDAGSDVATFMLAGPGAAAWLETRAAGRAPADILAHGTITAGGVEIRAVALDWFGPGGLLLQAPRGEAGGLAAWLRDTGLPEWDAAALDAARIEALSPEPCDIDSKTLPQELGRDARAISFTKGCYLGQETVARLDALGHVNRRLVAIATAAPPAVGATVTAAGGVVGTISSACAARAGGGLGLALVHMRGLDGAALEVDGMPGRVTRTSAFARREEG
jgi:folate-binding protein YgfZ